jgi:hypothetical protein
MIYGTGELTKHEHFCHFSYGSRHLEEGMFVVIAWFDGEPDLWLADGKIGLDSLRRFYDDERQTETYPRDIPFTILKEVKL